MSSLASVSGHIVEKNENDPFIEFDARVVVESEVGRNPSMKVLRPYIEDSILLMQSERVVAYWLGKRKIIHPPYGRVLVVNQGDQLSDAILFEIERRHVGVNALIHCLFTIEHTEPRFSLRFACASSTGTSPFCLDLDQSLCETELSTMGGVLAASDLKRHSRTLRIAQEVIQREVAANAGGQAVAGHEEDLPPARLH